MKRRMAEKRDALKKRHKIELVHIKKAFHQINIHKMNEKRTANGNKI